MPQIKPLWENDADLFKLCKHVAEQLDGRHGDPLNKGIGWIHAREFALEIIRRMEPASPAAPKAPTPALAVVNQQAEDAGLWFKPETAAEAYLQQELRKLHEAVEGKSATDCAIDALSQVGALNTGVDREALAKWLHEWFSKAGITAYIDYMPAETPNNLADALISSGLVGAK